jgi:flavin reductase (DIM6/NTAB) family NADH-FMN oxidoreductase RutF
MQSIDISGRTPSIPRTNSDRQPMFYETKDGHGLPHDPFRNLVAPRPIGWISTLSAQGVANLAPYSFFNAVCGTPPIVTFASEGLKDSAANALATGEFAVNVANRAMAEAMNATSARVASDIDEFKLAGLKPEACHLIAPPRVSGAPATLECKVIGSYDLVGLDGSMTDRRLVFGQVVAVHIDDRYLREGRFDIVKAGTIARLGYRDYTQVTEIFTMMPPQAVLDH